MYVCMRTGGPARAVGVNSASLDICCIDCLNGNILLSPPPLAGFIMVGARGQHCPLLACRATAAALQTRRSAVRSDPAPPVEPVLSVQIYIAFKVACRCDEAGADCRRCRLRQWAARGAPHVSAARHICDELTAGRQAAGGANRSAMHKGAGRP